MISGKTGMNITSTYMRAFLPSQQQWVFQWLFDNEFPTLMGNKSLEKVQLVITDGDTNEYMPIIRSIRSIYINAEHVLCSYHLVTQKLMAMRGKVRDNEESVLLFEKLERHIESFYLMPENEF